MKIKNRLKFQRRMKECLTLHCLLQQNLWKIKFITERAKTIFLINFYKDIFIINNIFNGGFYPPFLLYLSFIIVDTTYMLKGKKILLGITGSIAAYKSVVLLRLLIKAGAEVKVIMTQGAKDFVSPLTFSTLSKNAVLTDLFDENSWANHVMLGRWADVMLIAPASCNTLAKMANGQCDNLLLAVYLSSTCKVLVAPAMDEDMWHHPATQRNREILIKNGIQFLPVKN